MRYVVIGAGAIGGVLGGRLAEYGHDVVLVARGAHHDAIAANGLVIASPDGEVTVRTEVRRSASEVAFTEDDCAVIAVKSQDTGGVLDELAAVAPPSLRIVCAQNGVENERAALRRFANVYGMCVMCPATHLEPGRVEANSSPISGLMDLGRWPSGSDEVAISVAAALRASSFESEAREDIARWKWGKLLMNLGNAVQAACGSDPRVAELWELVRAEALACVAAADVDVVGDDEDAARRGGLLTVRPVGGHRRGGGSTWQSLTRGTGSVETDYLTGEIVLLGRLVGVPTPLNERLQWVVADMARRRSQPGTMTVDEVISGART